MRSSVIAMLILFGFNFISSIHKLINKEFPIEEVEGMGQRTAAALVQLGLFMWAAVVLWKI